MRHPAIKTNDLPVDGDYRLEFGREQVEALNKHIDELESLLKFVATKITVRDARGMPTRKLCSLCPRTGKVVKYQGDRKMMVAAPCRHDEIFRYLP